MKTDHQSLGERLREWALTFGVAFVASAIGKLALPVSDLGQAQFPVMTALYPERTWLPFWLTLLLARVGSPTPASRLERGILASFVLLPGIVRTVASALTQSSMMDGLRDGILGYASLWRQLLVASVLGVGVQYFRRINGNSVSPARATSTRRGPGTN